MCAPFTKTLKMSSNLGTVVVFCFLFFLTWFCPSKWKQGHFVNAGKTLKSRKHKARLHAINFHLGSGDWGCTIFVPPPRHLSQACFLFYWRNVPAWCHDNRPISSDRLPLLLYSRYTFLASLCCGRQRCWSWLVGRPRRRRLRSEIEKHLLNFKTCTFFI